MITKLQSLLTKLREDERGLSTVEYVVLLVLIVAIAVAIWNLFGASLTGKLQTAAKEFDQEVSTTKSGDVVDVKSENQEAITNAYTGGGTK